MQSKAKTYGQILKEVLEQAPENKHRAVCGRFRNLLKKRGDLRFLSKAVQEFQTAWDNRNGNKGTAVFAKTPSEVMRKTVAKALRRQGFVYEEKVDPDLVGGAEIFLGNEYVIDNTIRGKLQRLQTWQKTTSTKF